jgi:acetylornithine deacetylase/succinyl-diaminopimelate desuccinylase-like protein
MPMSNREKALDYARSQHDEFLNSLQHFVAIPSISTDATHKKDMVRTAEWIANKLTSIGIHNVQIFPTEGHPIVYGDYIARASDAPIVLIYGHYDVQPAEPLDLWESQPFEASIRGENLYARGASDMKGQMLASVDAYESVLKAGDPPVSVKFILEGEEEIGSPHIAPFVEAHKDLLASDVCLNPDTGMIAASIPTMTYALRGLAYFELRVFGPDHDLHSGVFGGIVHNPAQALCELIAGMHDGNGHITLPGFYDRVREVTTEEHETMSRLPMDEQFYLDQTGAAKLYGEKEFLPAERVGARPTLDVNGIISGFTGAGSKTVIPAWAMAKISMRLVPDQDPKEVNRQLRAYLNENCPPTVRWELSQFASSPASISDIHHPATQALAEGLETVWGKAPLFKREGGSVPIVGDFQRVLGIDSVLTGFGLSDDNIHAPNEKLHLPTWYRGIDTLIHFFYNYGENNHQSK